jgi:hypothetical protein
MRRQMSTIPRRTSGSPPVTRTFRMPHSAEAPDDFFNLLDRQDVAVGPLFEPLFRHAVKRIGGCTDPSPTAGDNICLFRIQHSFEGMTHFLSAAAANGRKDVFGTPLDRYLQPFQLIFDTL